MTVLIFTSPLEEEGFCLLQGFIGSQLLPSPSILEVLLVHASYHPVILCLVYIILLMLVTNIIIKVSHVLTFYILLSNHSFDDFNVPDVNWSILLKAPPL